MNKKKAIIISICVVLATIIALVGVFVAFSDFADDLSLPVSISLKGDKVDQINYTPSNAYRESTDCYLTEDKFIYSVLDESSSNTFGNASKLVIYDLKSGEAYYPIDEKKTPLSDIDNICLIDNELFFTAYAYTDYYENYNWGFCLFSLNMETNELKKIFQTPNTVDNIYPCVIDDSLYYCASTMTLEQQDQRTVLEVEEKYKEIDFHTYQLHKYKNGTDSLIASDLFEIGYLYVDDSIDSNIYLLDWQDKVTVLNTDGEKVKTDKETIKTVKAKMLKSEGRKQPENNQVFARFGDYEIVYGDIKKLYKHDCGFKYKCTYYLNDTKSGKQYKLSEGAYWYYYF